MTTKYLLIHVFLVIFIFINSSCSGENSRTSEEKCLDVEVADLNNSECLAESLLNVCNTFICAPGQIFEELNFMDCMLIDCDSLQCDDFILDKFEVEDIFISFTSNPFQPLGGEIQFSCDPLIQ